MSLSPFCTHPRTFVVAVRAICPVPAHFFGHYNCMTFDQSTGKKGPPLFSVRPTALNRAPTRKITTEAQRHGEEKKAFPLCLRD